jgi:pimeloyl-ACP methyl ester carboxylesterase
MLIFMYCICIQGDSILTEILSRYQRDPSVFPSSLVIDKVIFTNGGMYMREASLRLSQRLLSSSIAEEFSNLASNIDPTGYIPKHQLNTVFSSRVRNEPADTELGQLKTHQIQLFQDMLNFKGGNVILWRLAKYLQDRYACEERWMAALNKLQRSISIHFIWGSDDSVAPLNIPKLLIEKADLDSSKLTVVEGKGHFWMLENGDGEFWAAMMHDVIANGK